MGPAIAWGAGDLSYHPSLNTHKHKIKHKSTRISVGSNTHAVDRWHSHVLLKEAQGVVEGRVTYFGPRSRRLDLRILHLVTNPASDILF